jgi:ABC-type oligopeptide transport system substrate-binding subunit
VLRWLTLRLATMLLILASMVLVLAGCGGDDSSSDKSSDSSSQETKTESTSDEQSDDGGAATGSTTLTATVGPGFDIALQDPEGSEVSQLPAGSYTIKVSDKSDVHNFHLTGEGVDETTSVEEVTDTTWNVELKAGEYTFICDPHPDSMKGTFTVT